MVDTWLCWAFINDDRYESHRPPKSKVLCMLVSSLLMKDDILHSHEAATLAAYHVAPQDR